MADHAVDTIAAISTGLTRSGIGIVRISGPQAIMLADRIFYGKKEGRLADAPTHTVRYGHICDEDGVVDEVLVTIMRGPHSYTGEDVVEIGTHGGVLVMQKVLDTAIGAGARLADPGEFTKRAFLSGRIDLSQAEAVMDLIASGNRAAMHSAAKHLGGQMREKITDLRAAIMEETAFYEAVLDDPEHFDDVGHKASFLQSMSKVRGDIEALLSTADDGRIMKEGLRTVIVGRPNVGKSTLLNTLSGQDRAIVTDIAGTTRDVLEESVMWQGVPLCIVDTAGLRESTDAVEQIGVARAVEEATGADLLLYLVDGTAEDLLEEHVRLRELADAIGPDGWVDIKKKIILLRTKGDLLKRTAEDLSRVLLPGAPCFTISAKTGEGMDALASHIKTRFFGGELTISDEVYITNARHKDALLRAKEAIDRVFASANNDMPVDLYTVDLMDAYAILGEITGDDVSDDLIDEIFSRFCLGK